MPSLYETVRLRNIEVWAIKTSDTIPTDTGIGGTKLGRKRQNLNRSNKEMYLQLKSANLRTNKTVTACLR
jgi:hypothetical protein